MDNSPKSVYDPTCGAGNLLRVFPDEVAKYGQELDAEQVEQIDFPNFRGVSGDTLMHDGFKGYTFYMEGKYAGMSQSAMIEECYERVIDAIRYQSQTPVPAPSDKENKEWQK